MSLFKNETDHWEIPGNGELYSGDLVEVYMDGQWKTAWVDYRPRAGYSLRLRDGQLYPMDELMEIRPALDEKVSGD